MPTPYTPEQREKLYQKLPAELQDALYSPETAESIDAVCTRYGIIDARLTQIATTVGDVLLGIVLPAEFQEELQENVKLPEELYPLIAKDINRLVFYPLKPELTQLHEAPAKKEVETSKEPKEKPQPDISADLEPKEEKKKRVIPQEEPKTEDPYREIAS